ncbi:MAG TPA: TonB-dependent receptor [Chitinophagaceae bacterium]|jgi:TonB-linked SusC/RagA family outer membrane protein|nr:TonB-dependent receptor [Chitinophagaceae bacterium]
MCKNLRKACKWVFIFSFCITALQIHAQVQKKSVKEVRGTIIDSSGAVAGVSITVKNKQNIGTTTDLNGKFLLNVPEDAVLTVTMVGYEDQEISVKGKEVINVQLKRASTSMNDVVVVAYGKQKRREVVGSVTSITPSELKVPSSNLTTALAGRIAGVIAYQTTGEPGQDNAEFFIRGVTTFGYKKDPLILIDGIEYTANDLARIQPDDIASFSIMKDATASALYGARGANGVILVTTKEGRQGKAKINIRFENSISSPTRNIKLADPITYMNLHNESVLTRNPLAPLPYLQSKIDYTELGVNPYMFPAVDWMDMLFKNNATNRRGNFSVSGGGQIVNYFLAGSFAQDNGILKVDKRNNFNNNIDLKTYNLRSNIGIKVTRSTDVMVRLYGSFDDYNGPMDGGSGIYRKVMRTSPVLYPAYYPVDEEHKFVNHIMFGNYDRGNYLNPYADMVSGYKDYNKSLMSAQFEMKQDLSFLTQGLSVRAFTNINRQSFFDVSRRYNPFYYSAGSYDKYENTYLLTLINPDVVATGVVPQGGTDYLGDPTGTEKTVTSNFYVEAAANYNRIFNKHGLSGLVVLTARSRQDGNTGSIQKSLPYRNMGVSGRATYSYDNRYFAEFNFGYNGSERFYKTERYGFFPSAGFAWFVSNEKFFEPYLKVVTKLKFRGTYGLVGNDEIGSADDRFYYLSDVDLDYTTGRPTFGTDGAYTRNLIRINRYENPDITWETSRKTNLAIEIGLFSKWEIIAEYYREKRYNILMPRVNIPSTLGLQVDVTDPGQAPKANVGEASGEGVDISVDYTQNFGKNFLIQARGNFTYAHSRLDKNEDLQYGDDLYYLNKIGYPISQQWGYIAERLFVDDEEVKNSPSQNGFGDIVRGGDIKFRDVNEDGIIDKLDMVPIGYPTTPEITYGFGVSAKYKGFDISTFMQGTARRSFWIDVKATSPFVSYRYKSDELTGYILQNQLLKAYADDHWSEENRNLYALWPRLSSTVNNNDQQKSTWFMRNGAFLRLKQVEIGYTFPTKFTRKAHIDNVRLYANGINLFVISDFKLWDVEMAGNGLNYPIQKVINFGIQVGL